MTPTIHRYERVTYRPEGSRARTVFLEHAKVSGGLLTGIEVDREGVEVWGKCFDQRRHIISLELVLLRTPLKMDNEIGELVEEAS